MSHQEALKARACSKLVSLGMDGLKSWINALPDDDRALLDGWLVEAEQPAEAEPVEEAEEEPEPADPTPAEMETGYYRICPNENCKAEQFTVNQRCWHCQQDLTIKEPA